MKILLDTHALLWLITDNDKLSPTAKIIFLDQSNSLFFSAASIWEICIKMSLGKLDLESEWREIIEREMITNNIRWLPVEMPHCAHLVKLPFHHRDPFDRMLIAQAVIENMQILSCDRRFSDYQVDRVW